MNKSFTQLTDLDKVMLRYQIILKGTTDAQGDALRTSESYANQVKRLRANLTNTAEMLGDKLIPRFTEIVKHTNEWIVANKDLISTKADAFLDKISNALEAIAKHKDLFSDIAIGAGVLAKQLAIQLENLDIILNKKKRTEFIQSLDVLIDRYLRPGLPPKPTPFLKLS